MNRFKDQCVVVTGGASGIGEATVRAIVEEGGRVVETFALVPHLVLVVPTEGTRERADYWKSGFYHIARHAGVPIVPSFLDFGSKRGGFGPALTTTDDMRSDMQYFRDFYHGMSGKYPNQFGPVKLKEEENSAQ